MNRTIHLTTEYIQQAYNLMTLVRDHLPDDKKHFLRTKALTELFAHHARGDLMLGIKTPSGELVGMLIAQPAGTPSIAPSFNVGQGTALVQSVCIHPEYAGQGLSDELFTQLLKWAEQTPSVSSLHAKISLTNWKSVQLFLNHGFLVAHEGQDPVEHYNALIVQKHIPPLAQTVLFPSNTGHDFVPAAA